jgi:hypothetical protein
MNIRRNSHGIMFVKNNCEFDATSEFQHLWIIKLSKFVINKY